MNDDMPEGITWVRNGVLRCARCSSEKDVRGQKHTAFFREHLHCEVDPAKRPASSMSIREAMALQILAGMVVTRGSGEKTVMEAVAAADRLLEALSPLPVMDPEEFEFVAEEASRRLDVLA